ncbi:MAG: ornithine carbamoyltransferase [Bacilli bacterium]|nr:ornithine carbamoyltransferase [Bacilli bacterium]
MVDLRGRDFLTLLDYTPKEIEHLLKVAETLKKQKHNHESHRYLKGKQVALLFEKDSTRTRCAFEAGAKDLGMEATYIGPTGSQMGKKETIADTARVLCRMFDGIEYRGFSQKIVEDLAKYSSVPVWNGLTDEYHPTQMLADVMTVKEEFGKLKGIKLVFLGDARNNVGNSLMVVCSKLGMHFTCCAPKELFPNEELVKKCNEIAKTTGATITLTDDVMKGTKDADVLYTDVWLSMGEPMEKWKERIDLLSKYQLNKKIMNNAKKTAIFLHCLPSFHNIDTTIGKDIYDKFGLKEMEVTDEVFESSQSRVFEEAENRLHTIKAVMLETLKK